VSERQQAMMATVSCKPRESQQPRMTHLKALKQSPGLWEPGCLRFETEMDRNGDVCRNRLTVPSGGFVLEFLQGFNRGRAQ
jgi:hypothetical protein